MIFIIISILFEISLLLVIILKYLLPTSTFLFELIQTLRFQSEFLIETRHYYHAALVIAFFSISIPLSFWIFFLLTVGFSIFSNFKIQFFATQVNLERSRKRLPRDECDVRAYRKWRECSSSTFYLRQFVLHLQLPILIFSIASKTPELLLCTSFVVRSCLQLTVHSQNWTKFILVIKRMSFRITVLMYCYYVNFSCKLHCRVVFCYLNF